MASKRSARPLGKNNQAVLTPGVAVEVPTVDMNREQALAELAKLLDHSPSALSGHVYTVQCDDGTVELSAFGKSIRYRSPHKGRREQAARRAGAREAQGRTRAQELAQAADLSKAQTDSQRQVLEWVILEVAQTDDERRVLEWVIAASGMRSDDIVNIGLRLTANYLGQVKQGRRVDPRYAMAVMRPLIEGVRRKARSQD
jgi:hypothetical protein